MGTPIAKKLALSALFLTVVAASANAADDFGIITDLAGSAEVKRGAKSVPASIGLNLIIGDNLIIGKNGRAAIVSYDKCLEWTIKGPVNTELKYGGIQSNGKKIKHDRRLPVCYSMSEVNTKAGEQMGGIVLRGAGPKDPVADLRDEFTAGTATNSTILTLLMHDLNSGNIEKSRPYYDELKKRIPDAEIIGKLAPVFDTRKVE